jgi:hypothetical protein
MVQGGHEMQRSAWSILLVAAIAAFFYAAPPWQRRAAAAGNASADGSELNIASFANLSAAKSALGSRRATLAITTPQQVNNLTIPANVTLRISDRGGIAVQRGGKVVIKGPFQAPNAQVFSGEGTVVFGAGSARQVYPEWWGAEDGRESAAAIQSAIDSIVSGDVILSEKSYLLNRRVRMRLIGSADRVDVILVPKSGVNLAGRGERSVLRVADGFTRGGDYVVFAPRNAEETSDLTFSNFRIDGNGPRNLVRGMAGGELRRAMALWLFRGKNITIDRVRFDNQPGSNTVKLGSDHVSYLVTDSAVTGCSFANVGGAIPGNRAQADHSTLYVSGRQVTVSGNLFSNAVPHDENGPPVAVVAAIEMHGDDMVVAQNRVENYGTGGYIVADGIVTARNQRWTGNTFRSLTKLGISIWSVGEVADAVIDGNEIELNGALDQGVSGIFQPLSPPDTTVGISGLVVTNNRIYGSGVKSGTVWHGMQLTAVRDALVQGNLIERVSGAGVLIYGSTARALDCRNIAIKGNTLRDTGFNRYGAYPHAIEIVNDGQGRFEGITVSENLVESTLPLTRKMRGIGVQGKGALRAVRIGANRSHLQGGEQVIDADREGVTVSPAGQ